MQTMLSTQSSSPQLRRLSNVVERAGVSGYYCNWTMLMLLSLELALGLLVTGKRQEPRGRTKLPLQLKTKRPVLVIASRKPRNPVLHAADDGLGKMRAP